MLLVHKQSGLHVEYNLNGTVITSGDMVVDLADRQGDSQVIVDVSVNVSSGESGGIARLVEGIGGNRGYVASIVLPPRQYELVDSGTFDSQGNPVFTRTALPMDTGKIAFKLWGYEMQ